jgi:hypothetical protein
MYERDEKGEASDAPEVHHMSILSQHDEVTKNSSL